MRWPVSSLLFVGICCGFSGCRSTAPCEVVEAELRSRNDELRHARFQLNRTSAYTNYLERELRNLRQSHIGKPLLPGASTATPITKIELGRQTGGYEKDGIPGDEMLQVVIEPRDGDGHAVKAAGTVEVQALTVSKEGLKAPLCQWVVPQNRLGRYWRSGLLSTGYFVQLPWKNWPLSSNVRVVVRFLAADQRVFEADKDVTVRVVPLVLRRAIVGPPAPDLFPDPACPPPLPTPGTGLPTGQPKPSPPQMPRADAEAPELLPVPRPVEEDKKEEKSPKPAPKPKEEEPLSELPPPTISTSEKQPVIGAELLAPIPMSPSP